MEQRTRDKLMENTQALGTHLIIDYYDCKSEGLDNPEHVQHVIEAAAKEMGATIVASNFHHFSPLGVSGVLVIAESHITIHTWPEHNYAAIDIFYCGKLDIENGLNKLKAVLMSERIEMKELKRGTAI
jgi:S-adenosylmethionine decarboxylase proenzyme